MPMAICGKATGKIQNASRIGFSTNRPRTDAKAAAELVAGGSDGAVQGRAAGSRESLLRQNERDTAEGLVRIQDDAQLNAMRAARELVVLPASSALAVNPGLPYNRRYCRPWTAHFLSDLSSSHYQRFHRSLQVNSAVRTVDFQRSLMLVNGNAAAADGDLASPHLTGAAIDIGKKGLSESEIAWMRAWLLPLQTAGKIDVEEEFYQSCFHITVYSSYAPSTLPRVPRAPRRHSSSTLLAASIR